MIWTVGDRGPNIACSEMKEIAGIDFAPCKGVQNGRVYPTPSYAPSIYRVMLLDDGTFRVTDVITLKDRDGRPLIGMLNPLKTAATENAMDGTGKPLPRELNGFDAEGIVRLADGTFWIGDENGPSIAHFAADGRMIARHVPRGHRRRVRGRASTTSRARCRRSWPSARSTAASSRWRSRRTSASSISSCRTRSPIRT